MAYVVIENGALQGQKYDIAETLILGRHSTCDVILRTPGISRKHCRLFSMHNKFFIEDLQSRNGTYLNGESITKNELTDNDIINISNYIVRFVSPPEERSKSSSVIIEDDVGKHYDKAMSMESIDPSSGIGPADESELIEGSSQAMQMVIDLRKRLDNLFQVTNALSSTTDEEELFQQILGCLLKVFPQAYRALLITGNTIDVIEVKLLRYQNPDQKKKSAVKISRSVISDVLNKREALLIGDMSQDEQFGTAVSIIAQNICSIMCVPLISQGELYGILQIENVSVTNPFTEKDLNDIAGVSKQAALFMRNAKLAKDFAQEATRTSQLQRFFSPAVAKEVMNNKLKLGGELRQGCTMFCDIVGFTSRSEKNSAEEIIKQLNQYFGVMVGIILSEKGTIDKFGGDAIMAIWGAPVAVENDAAHAMSCTLQMQNAIVRFNQDLAAENSDPVAMGIGIHAGEFIAGNIGSKDRMEYTVIGDDVNIAARVEAQALGNMVMASKALVAKIGQQKILGCSFNPISLKGKSEVFELTCIRGMETDEGPLLSIPVKINDQSGKITFYSNTTEKYKFVGGQNLSMGQASLKLDTPEWKDDTEYPIILTANSEGIFYDFIFDQEPPYINEMFEKGIIDTQKNIDWKR